MEEKKLNEKESLELIARMIRNTQERMESRDAKTFLLFGYLILFTTLLVWALLQITGSDWPHALWYILPIAGCGQYLIARNRPKPVTTYIDKMIGYIWVVLIISIILMPFSIPILGAWGIGYKFPILFSIFQLVTIGITITGLIVRVRPFIIGGAIGILLCYGFLRWPGEISSYVLFGLISLASMIIPGHIVLAQAKKQPQN